MAEPQTPTTLVDWLDDLSVRFLLNLPKSELSSVPRLCFQVEEAQWFYEDFVRPAVAASGAQPLPSLPLRQFCLMLFQHCPLLSGYNDAQHIAAYEEFLAYKVRVPVRGAILLDESMENVVLVRGWKKGSSWSFPRGKINKDEKDLDCAVREVYEETGYDARQAGLVPDQEKGAKYIDIVMREQHMRLFVFRGVPEDTHFEPKTRKEISKIQWYSIKDLPGFKKQKHAQAGDAGNANKFYMVAPFLGQLKKWINLQRKKDASQPRHTRVTSDGLGIQTATEDEGETEDATPEPALAPDKRSEDLKRLLSIGGGNAVPAQQLAPQQETQRNDLLAMLRGGAQPATGHRPPQTPFEQVDTVPQEPKTPHPDHMRHPQMPPQQQPPQYPLSPQRVQQEQQRNHSLPTPQIFGPGPHVGGFPPGQQSNGFPGMIPPHMQQQQQQQFQQRQSVPNMPFGYQSNMPFNGPQGRQQMPPPPPQLPPQQQHPMQPPPPQQAPNAYMVQGPQGAIASGPAAPNPSQLPAPRLNAHHMNLLNAFKSGNKPAAASVVPGQPTSRHGSTHQAALLDLFRKSSTTQTPPADPEAVHVAPVEQAVSPTLSNVTEKPPQKKKQERKPTLNEITRTLPAKLKVKSPPPGVGAASPLARPASGQLFDPNAGRSSHVPSSQTSQKQQSSVAVLQRPASGQGQQPQPQPQRQPTQSKPSSSLAQDTPPKQQKQNDAPPAPTPFTILARPGSRGLKSPAPVAPPSPLRNQTPQNPASSSPVQPQILKRPKGVEGDTLAPGPALEKESMGQQPISTGGVQGEGQKDHLLALFGKGSAGASSSTSIQSPPAAPVNAPSPSPTAQGQGQAQASTQRNALLDLLKSPSPSVTPSQHQQQQQPPSAPSPSLEPPPTNPPSAPRLSPSRNPSSSTNPHAQHQPQGSGQSQGGKIHPIRQPVQPPTNHHQPQHSSSHSRGGGQGQQQNLLLDIFTRPSSSASHAGGGHAHKRTMTPELRSPGTPISPFTLGTPAQTGFGDRVARGGSIASVASASSGEGRRGSGVPGSGGGEARGTPTDASAREFLMGFLNGVARGDGQGRK